jgi:hypothetical protein
MSLNIKVPSYLARFGNYRWSGNKCGYDLDRGSFRVLEGGKAPSLFEKAGRHRHHGKVMKL